MAERIARPMMTLAGWPLVRVGTAALLLAALVWAAWATRTLVELRERRIVSVSLSRLVEDFVAAEARNGGSPEDAAKRTGAYLGAVNRAVTDLARDGTTVLVSEATLGRSVPDRTAQVRAAVSRSTEAARGER